jgi:transposase-like protein
MPATVDLTNPIFTDIEAAREHFEAIRWPQGCYCPYCGSFDRVAPLGGKSMGPGWYHCKDCRKKFTAAVGTIYERSHIPMTKWLLATHLMCASKKGMSAHQLHRMIGLPYKTAWFMAHRIREGMRDLKPTGPLGGEGKTVEFDETYVGGKERNKHVGKRNKKNIGGASKEAVFSLGERGGKVRSHRVPNVTAKTLRPIMDEQIADATLARNSDLGFTAPAALTSRAIRASFLFWTRKRSSLGLRRSIRHSANYFVAPSRGFIGWELFIAGFHVGGLNRDSVVRTFGKSLL